MNPFRAFFFFFLFSVSCLAGDSTAVRQKRFAIGIQVSPDYCYRQLVIGSSTRSAQLIADSKDAEIPRLGYSAGLTLYFDLKPTIAVGLGALYSLKGFKTKVYPVVDATGNELGKGYFLDNYHYIDVPVRVRFLFGKKDLRGYFSAGVSPAFILYEQKILKTDYEKAHKYAPDYINHNFNLFTEAEGGVNIRMSEKMELRFGPYCSYALRNTSAEVVTNRLWSVGLTIGCDLRF